MSRFPERHGNAKLSFRDIRIITWRYLSGESSSDILKDYNITKSTITENIKKCGVKPLPRSLRGLSWKDWIAIKSYYKDNKMSLQSIADMYGIPRSSVDRVLREMNVSRRSHSNSCRRYTLDQEAFADSKDPEVQYWSGFIMADGCVCDSSKSSDRLQITLSARDSKHLNKFKRFLSTNKPIHKYKREGFSYVSLRISSNRISRDLRNYGVVPRKTFTGKVASIIETKHFWRGMVDGDGWISGIGRYPALSLSGNKYNISSFYNFIADNLSIGGRIQPHSSVYKIRFNGSDVEAIVRFLYKSAGTFLTRKYERANCLWQS